MADKKYRLSFAMSDGTTKSVEFTAPQGEKGEKGEKGDTGSPGADGAAGARGETGEKGDTGIGITSISIAEV